MDTTGLAELTPAALIIGKATAVLLLALLLSAVMQRASATSRHLMWLASLLALVAIPLLTVWSPVRFAVLPSTWNVAGTVASGSVFSTDGADVSSVSRALSAGVHANPRDLSPGERASRRSSAPSSSDNAPESASPSATAISPSAPAVVDSATAFGPLSAVALIAVVWAAVALCLMLWLACGFWSVRRIVRAATPLVDAEWQGAMIDIADRLELDATPRLLRAVGVTMPFACGLRTPTIVMPEDCDGWSGERRAAVLLHELAHIRRRDIVGHTLGRVVCAAYWFHPLVWLAARRLRSESERACDDLALGCGTRASDYAEHLLDIVTSVRNHGTPSVAMAMATRSEFEGRMLAILDPSLSRTAPTRVQASTLAGGVMMFAIVTGSFVPREASIPATGAELTARREMSPTSGVQQTNLKLDVRIDSLLGEAASDGRHERTQATTRLAAAPANTTATSPVSASLRSALPLIQSDLTQTDSNSRSAALSRVLKTDTSAELRRLAAWGLHGYGQELDPIAIDALIYALRRDQSPAVREMAAWRLMPEAPHPHVADALLESIRLERNSVVRESAIWALGHWPMPQSAAMTVAIADAATDASPAVRETALWAMGNAYPSPPPAAAIAALRDANVRVRTEAAWALYKMESLDAIPPLTEALGVESDASAQRAMVRALCAVAEEVPDAIARLVDSKDASVRAQAIRCLAGPTVDPWPQPRPRPRPFP